VLWFCQRNERVRNGTVTAEWLADLIWSKSVSAGGSLPDAQSDSGALPERKLTEKASARPICEYVSPCLFNGRETVGMSNDVDS